MWKKEILGNSKGNQWGKMVVKKINVGLLRRKGVFCVRGKRKKTLL